MTGARRNWIQFSILRLVIAGLGLTAWRSANALDELRRTHNRLATEFSLWKNRESMALAEERSVAAKVRERERNPESQAAALSPDSIAQAMERKIEEMKIALASEPPPPRLPPLPDGPTGNMFFAELFGDPVYAALARKFWEVQTETMHGPLLAKLNGSPEKRERYRALLVERALGNFRSVERGAAWRKAEQEIMDEMRATLGEAWLEGNRSYQVIESRKVVMRFTERLSYSPQPLSQEQENQLVELMVSATDPKTGRNIPARSLTPEIVEQAKVVLSPAQFEALRKFAGVK